jgi:transcriptional regulator with XRE-family HTH domain
MVFLYIRRMNLTPLTLPDTMTAADIGPYMASLRAHYGLTQQQVAERIHIRIRYLKAIEEGDFTQLPGVVYARGYVNTYAEFLGLAPEQVVGICFGAAPAREAQTHVIPEPARQANRASMPKNWLTYVGIGVFALGLLSVLGGGNDDAFEASETTVERVPESMLSELRSLTMPTPSNVNCLRGRGMLSCFYAARSTQRWLVPKPAPGYYFLMPEDDDA